VAEISINIHIFHFMNLNILHLSINASNGVSMCSEVTLVSVIVLAQQKSSLC